MESLSERQRKMGAWRKSAREMERWRNKEVELLIADRSPAIQVSIRCPSISEDVGSILGYLTSMRRTKSKRGSAVMSTN
jgi:hypothetical protein